MRRLQVALAGSTHDYGYALMLVAGGVAVI